MKSGTARGGGIFRQYLPTLFTFVKKAAIFSIAVAAMFPLAPPGHSRRDPGTLSTSEFLAVTEPQPVHRPPSGNASAPPTGNPSVWRAPVYEGNIYETTAGAAFETPLVDDFIHLPIQIHDATSASLLMKETQEIIEATRIIVPPGYRGLELMGFVEEVLRRNLELEAARKNPLIEETFIDSEWAEFDPTGFATITISRTNRPVAGFFGGGIGAVTGEAEIARVVDTFRGSGSPEGVQGIGATQRFSSGLQATIQALHNRTDTNVGFFQPFDQEYNTQLILDVVQPLCRGYGPEVNLANVRIAYNNQLISEEDLRRTLLEIVAAAHRSYWELAFARVDLAIKQQSLALAADLLRENRIRYKYGDLVIVEVYEAEAGVRSREQEVIQAENSLENRMDDIRELVNADEFYIADWEIPIIPTDPAIYHPVEIDESLSFELAMEKSPEIRAAELEVKNSRENQVIARDAFKPQLDVVARVSETGLGETWSESHRELFSGNFTSWSVGVDYSLPLRRRRELAGIRAANLQESQAEVLLRNARQIVMYDHREAVRNIKTLAVQVIASKARVHAEKERLEKQRIGYEQGITTSHDLLEVQEDYAQAQSLEIRAIVEYFLALIELERIRGTLLDTLGFEMIPVENAP